MARRSDIAGMSELESTFKELGRIPQTVATKAARAGGTIARRAAKAYAPVDTGELKRSLILKRERSRTKGKAVFDVMPDPAMNSVFVKIGKNGKRSYYPASQEYGYLLPNGRYIPGYRYLRRAADNHEQEIERKILDVTGKEVDKALKKRRSR